ncbi:MAG TPA: class I SAM-dependent methyltransferase [Thermomicrobiaceae bacterium]|nr:class I SAM-dependent methyltransferase [Thermomicrobiaceae bacterium]
MSEPPGFLRPDVAAVWEDAATAAAYARRPTYPPAIFDILAGLVVDAPRAVLDLGCGTGFVARPLAPRVARVDAVDASAAMVDEGRRLPGGDAPNLRWIVGRAEEAPLDPPYALVTAGESLHWMDWGVLLPRLAGTLTPGGALAILDLSVPVVDPDLRADVVAVIRRYSTFTEWRPDFDLVAELERRGLFRRAGRAETDVVPLRQPVDAYVESFHARASLAWPRMAPDAAAAFDAELRQAVLARVGETVELAVRGVVVWGRPLGR